MWKVINLGKDTANLAMKTNNKGQALVEFVIILPIIMMVLFIVIDFSNIFYQKNHLEGTINEVVELKENRQSDKEIKNIVSDKDTEIHYEKNGDKLKIKINKKVNLITPFSNLFFDNPFTIKSERTILYE